MGLAYPAFRDALSDRVEFEREIGSGATATVFLAHDRKHQRRVAVKVLWPEFAATLAAERFLREIEIAAQLQHPHILPLLDSGEAAGSLYFIMPFVEGETLRQRLQREGRLGVGDTIRILADVADALRYAHDRGVVHRDIKPDNIILSGRHALVMDFGVAKATSAAQTSKHLTAGLALGTPAYMAPEQALADPNLDQRVDLYALGVLGYEMLSGRPPFVRSTPQEVLTAHVVQTPESIESLRPEVPLPLATLVMRALAKRPEERWQSAGELVDQLDPLATPSGGMPPAAPAGRRGLTAWLAASGTVLAVAAMVWLAGRGRHVPPAGVLSPQQLSFAGSVTESAVSPDGAFLAFVGQGADVQQLFVQDLDGNLVLPLAAGPTIETLSWSADGSEISYGATDSTGPFLAVSSRLGGQPRVLRRGRGLRSPDGRWIAVAEQSGPTVTLVDTRSGDSVVIRRSPGYRWITGAAWTHDSERLIVTVSDAASRRSALATFGTDGRETMVLIDSVGLAGPAWDPSGPAIYYLRGDGDVSADLMRVRVGRGGVEPAVAVAGLAVGYNSGSIALSPVSTTRDGHRVVYTRKDRWSNLGLLPLAGGNGSSVQPITMGTALYSATKVSPDGSTLALFRERGRAEPLGIVPIGGGAVQELVPLVDGVDVAWSPTGRQIAFLGQRPGAEFGLGVYDLDAGTTRWLLPEQTGGTIAWADSVLVVGAAGNRRLMLVNPRTGETRPVGPADSSGSVFAPRLSQDGRELAFSWRQGGAFALWTTGLGGGPPRMLSAMALWPIRWARDGRSLYAVSVRGPRTELWRVRADGGGARRVTAVPAGLVIEDLLPDERTLLVNDLRQRSDAVALDWRPAAGR